jgi:hypothetical protein
MINDRLKPNIYLMHVCYIAPLSKTKPDPDLDTINQDHEWLCRMDLGPFAGQWIAVLERKILASDKDIEVLMKKLEALKITRKPLLFKVPALPLAVGAN